MTKIAIDAGHGLYTPGKRCLKSLDSSETREWRLNDRIADKLVKMLENRCEVMRVDDTSGGTDVSLANRVKKANNWGADFYISIHHDAGIAGGSGGGTTVYYYSNDKARETLARRLYDCVVGLTGLKGNRSNPVIKNGFYVIKNTKMAALLIENGFMDSKTDVPVILSESHAEKTAQGILNFLVSEFNLSGSAPAEHNSTSGGLYKVQCGAFANKANAEALKNELKAAGYEAVIVHGG